MWKKYREKKEAKKHHSGNFNTGYVAAKEHYLNRSGLRGRKRWIFFAIFLLVCIVTLAHLTVRDATREKESGLIHHAAHIFK